MKTKALTLVAAASVLAAATNAMAYQVDVIVNTTDPWLVANNLQSAIIRFTNLSHSGAAGVIGTPEPAGINFAVETTDAGGFFNIGNNIAGFGGNTAWSTRPVAAFAPGFGADINEATFDTGLIGPTSGGEFGHGPSSPWSDLTSGLGTWAHANDGSSYVTDSFVWLHLNADGWPVNPGDTIDIMQVTWSAKHAASGRFLLGLVGPAADPDGETEVEFTWSVPPVPAPGALALLGLAGLVGARRRRN